MILEATTAELVELAVAVTISGVFAGVLAGLFGIGGGAVLVPVFYHVIGLAGVDEAVRMHLSVGTSLGVILPTAISSFLAHRARGTVDLPLLRGWLFWVPLGVVAATTTAARLSGEGLRGVFAAIALVVALRMIFNRATWLLGDDLPGNPFRAFIGVLIGYLSTLMGIGGGILNNTFMTLFNRPIHQAVATSSGLGILIAIPGTIGYVIAGWNNPALPPLSAGFVNLLGVAIVIPVTLFTAPLGVRFAHAVSRRTLEIGFGLFLLTVSARFAWSLA